MGEIYFRNISCVCDEGCLYIGYDWKFVRIVDIDKDLKIQINKKRKKEMQIVIRIVIVQNKYWWKKFLYYSLVILYYVFQMLEV